MELLDLSERAQDKALAKIMAIGYEIEKYNQLLDKGCWKLSSEQIQLVIDKMEEEVELWKFILNRTQ